MMLLVTVAKLGGRKLWISFCGRRQEDPVALPVSDEEEDPRLEKSGSNDNGVAFFGGPLLISKKAKEKVLIPALGGVWCCFAGVSMVYFVIFFMWGWFVKMSSAPGFFVSSLGRAPLFCTLV